MAKYLCITVLFLIPLLSCGCIKQTKTATIGRKIIMNNSDMGDGDSQIIDILADTRNKYSVPAMAAALLTSQGIQKVAVIGTRKYGTDTPATLNDLWHLGSDTKMMTSTIVARLIEKEKLTWLTTVSDIFPELIQYISPEAKNITVLQLLSHMSGLPEDIDCNQINRSIPIREQRMEAVKIALGSKPLSQPGTQYLYSNIGYIIIGTMIERILNLDWETVISQEIFTPLKMYTAGVGGLGTIGKIDQPWGHEHPQQPFFSNGPEADIPPVAGPAGRVHCTIQDWALFIADQLRGARGEPALLKPNSYKMLQYSHFDNDYALGWGLMGSNMSDKKTLVHTGSNGLYFALVWAVPEKNYAILICTNEGPESFNAAHEALERIRQIENKH